MFGWLKGSRESVVSFCDRCAQVCDDRCRRGTVKDEAALGVLRFGVRF